jgi:hypothetical protein
MVTDRCTTACLLVFLSSAWPRWAILFQGLISLDLASHYMHMYATLSMGGAGESHKKVDSSRSWILHQYYTSRVRHRFPNPWYQSLILQFRPSYSSSAPSTNSSSLPSTSSRSLLRYSLLRSSRKPLLHPTTAIHLNLSNLALQPDPRLQASFSIRIALQRWNMLEQTRWTASGRGFWRGFHSLLWRRSKSSMSCSLLKPVDGWQKGILRRGGEQDFRRNRDKLSGIEG